MSKINEERGGLLMLARGKCWKILGRFGLTLCLILKKKNEFEHIITCEHKITYDEM